MTMNDYLCDLYNLCQERQTFAWARVMSSFIIFDTDCTDHTDWVNAESNSYAR